MIARSLVSALRDAGHRADLVVTPQNRFGRQAAAYLFDEDYGFVTVETFASAKPVITPTDSGGPTELVQDGVSGDW